MDLHESVWHLSKAALNGLVMVGLSVATPFAVAQNYAPSSDSASTPGHSWNGDTNTGIFRPAADIVGIATSGIERFRIDTSGRIGIGLSLPNRLLQVAGTIRLTPTTNPGSPGAGDLWFDSSTSNTLKYHNGSAWVSVTSGGDYLANGTVNMTGNIRLNNNWLSNDGGSEGMRITNDGNVIMGNATYGMSYTNIPALAFVRSGLPPYVYLEDSGQDTMMFGKDNDDYFTFASEDSMNGIAFKVAGAYGTTPFITQTSTAMTIRNSGFVGIATTNPSTQLQVAGTVTATAFAGNGSALTQPAGTLCGMRYLQCNAGAATYDSNSDALACKGSTITGTCSSGTVSAVSGCPSGYTGRKFLTYCVTGTNCLYHLSCSAN